MDKALTNSDKARKTISWILASMLMAGLLSGIINNKYLLLIGLILVLMSFILGSLYGIFIKGLSMAERLIIFTMSFILLIQYSISLHHWKGAGIAQIAMIIPMAMFIYITFRMPGKLRQEFSFLLLMAVYALLTLFGI